MAEINNFSVVFPLENPRFYHTARSLYLGVCFFYISCFLGLTNWFKSCFTSWVCDKVKPRLAYAYAVSRISLEILPM